MYFPLPKQYTSNVIQHIAFFLIFSNFAADRMYKLGSSIVTVISIYAPLVQGNVLYSGLERKGDSCMLLALKSLSSHPPSPWCQPVSQQKVTITKPLKFWPINLLMGL
jgi:hypothetical protein